jgi:hypothetical protein
MPTLKTLTAATLTLTTAILTGCTTRRPAELVSAKDVAVGKAAFARIADQIYGTPAQRAAAEERSYLTAQAAIADCAARAGIDYAITAFVPVTNPDSPVAPGDLLGFAPLRADFGVATRIIRLAAHGSPTNPGLAQATTAAATANYFTTIEQCQDAATAGDRQAVPDGQEALEAQFVTALTEQQNFLLPPDEPWRKCMTQQGINTWDLTSLYVQVESKYPPVSYDTPSDPTRLPGWAAAWAYETRAAASDVTCRTHQVDLQMALVPDFLADFEHDNTAALQATAAGWHDMPAALQSLRATVHVTG